MGAAAFFPGPVAAAEGFVRARPKPSRRIGAKWLIVCLVRRKLGLGIGRARSNGRALLTCSFAMRARRPSGPEPAEPNLRSTRHGAEFSLSAGQPSRAIQRRFIMQ